MEFENQISILKNQFDCVIKFIEEENKWVYYLMGPAISEMGSLLFIPKNITHERLSKYKEILHLLDSTIAGMDKHSGGPEIDHIIFWSYLYSLKDTLEFILEEKNNEE